MEHTTGLLDKIKFYYVYAWKYNNTRDTISFSISKISFIFLMTPMDSTNDPNICVELFKATFTHWRSNYASKKKFGTALDSLLFYKHFRNLEGRNLNLLGNEYIVR